MKVKTNSLEESVELKDILKNWNRYLTGVFKLNLMLGFTTEIFV